jgi:hypothetical protein
MNLKETAFQGWKNKELILWNLFHTFREGASYFLIAPPSVRMPISSLLYESSCNLSQAVGPLWLSARIFDTAQ